MIDFWRQQFDYIQAVNKLAYMMLKSSLSDVLISLLSSATYGGNVKAQELILKYCGNYVERSESKIDSNLNINVGIVDDEDEEEDS